MSSKPKTAIIGFALLILTLSAVSGVNALTPITSQQVAGYQVTTATAGDNITAIKGSWVVPTLVCASGENSASYTYIQIDGLGNTADTAYVGTYANCVAGTPTYGAFYGMVPGTSKLKAAFPGVTAGDKISASASWSSKKGWSVSLSDSASTAVGKAIDNPSTPLPKLNSGAFLVGRSSANLANFGTMSFGAASTGDKKSCVLTAGFSNKTVSTVSIGVLGKQTGFTLNQINLVNSGSTVMATTGALDKSGKDFAITWNRAT